MAYYWKQGYDFRSAILTMTAESTERTTVLLPQGSQENIMVLRYSPELMDELEGLAKNKQLYDVLVLDVSHTGFQFTAQELSEAADRAKKLLTVQGGMIFAHPEKVVVVVRDSVMGGTSLHVFHSISELYDYSATFARHVQAALGDNSGQDPENTDLSRQVLMSSVPVLTQFGIKMKAGMESTRLRNQVLTAIDSYTPVSALIQRMASKQVSQEELLEELKQLEQISAIYPIFERIPFLVHCFRNQIPFKLKDYLIAAQLLTTEQLDEISFDQQNTHGKERMSLGALAVGKGFISTRQFEVALQDLAFYGQSRDMEKVKLVSNTTEQSQVQSLIGHLGTTDPAGLLQNLATNRETGVLSVEHRDLQFRAAYENGKLTHARLNKLKGNHAIVEFVSVWTEGIFVFMQRHAPADLAHESCKLSRALDKLLLDSALAHDNVQVVWKKLPKAAQSSLEKLEDTEKLLAGGKIIDPQTNKPLHQKDVETMQRVWGALDGITAVAAVIKNLGDVTTYQAAEAIDRLLQSRLVSIPAGDISGPLDKFRLIVKNVGEKIGAERNLGLLRLSLQAAQGYSARARMFSIGASGEVGFDLVAARSAGTSLSVLLKDLEDWQVKYVEYCSQELDRNLLRDIVYKVHQKG